MCYRCAPQSTPTMCPHCCRKHCLVYLNKSEADRKRTWNAYYESIGRGTRYHIRKMDEEK